MHDLINALENEIQRELDYIVAIRRWGSEMGTVLPQRLERLEKLRALRPVLASI